MKELPPLPRPPDPQKQLQGLRSRARGVAFEERLQRSFDYYNERGFALIYKTPEPFKIIKRLEHTRFIGCFVKRAQPDYQGTIKGGRTVVFEAKYTDADRLHQDAVNEEQEKFMDRKTALGARCYVIAGFRNGSVYRIPWPDWKDMKRLFGHKYVTEAQIEKYRVKQAWNDTLMLLE